jgi:hypothetical protein
MEIGPSDIETVIRSLALKASSLPSMTSQGATAPNGWWVLAVGDSLALESLEQRDKARERLRLALFQAGLQLGEHHWIWDETERCQLVLERHAEREGAEARAVRLRAKGLLIRVVREWDA